jgi:hypothetical protein
MTKEKTHWLQNPNKNYLGHQDLPNGEDIILTIKTAQWESVENPRTRKHDDKRVVRFKESSSWIKPFIVNETNAAAILKSTGQRFMEDCEDKRIKLKISQTIVMGEEVDCLRVISIPQSQLQPKTISKDLANNIINLIEKIDDLDNIKFCEAMKINAITELSIDKYDNTILRLNSKIEKQNANN